MLSPLARLFGWLRPRGVAALPPALASFRGVHFGMDHAAAVEHLKREAASRGETVTVDEYSDPTDGTPSTYLSFPHFTLSLPQGESCRVSGRLAFYRDEPLDLDAAVAWLAERAARYGPPAFIVVRNFHVDHPVTVALRWVDPMNTSVELALRTTDGKDGWMVREEREHDPNYELGSAFRMPEVDVTDYLSRLRAANARRVRLSDAGLAPYREEARAKSALVGESQRWVPILAEVLERLVPLAAGAAFRVDPEGLTLAERVLTLHETERGPASDGAFVRCAAASEHAAVLRHALWQLTSKSSLRFVQLTRQHDPALAPELPSPPEEQIDWVGGSIAARLLREDLAPALRAANASVVSATLAVVPGAVEEWLSIPTAPIRSRFERRLLRPTIFPLRLHHPPTARSVYVNGGASREELLVYAHALLAVLMG